MTVVGTLEAELKADPSIWEAAMKRATESMEKMATRVEASSQKIRATNKAADDAASTLQRLQGSAKDLGERFLKVGAVTGGMGAAFATAVPQMQGAVSAAGGLAMAFAAGGPLLAGLALAATVLGAVASKLSSMKEEADKASAALQRTAKESADAAVRALADATKQEQLLRLLRRQAAAPADQRDAIAVDEAARNAAADISQREGKIADLRKQISDIEARATRTMGVLEAAQAGVAQGTTVAVALSSADQERLDTLRKQVHDERVLVDTLREEVERTREIARLRAGMATSPGSQSSAGGNADLDNPSTPLQMAALIANDLELVRAYQELEAETIESRVRAVLRSLQAERDRIAVEQELEGATSDATQAVSDLAQATDALANAQQTGAAAANAIAAIGSGAAGSAALTAGLGAAGAAASVALGDPTGQLGGQIGQALGSVLGPIADELMAQLDTLGPLMDSLRTVVSGLLPVFGVLGGFAGILGAAFDFLAPVVLAASQVLVAIQVPVLRLTETVLPLLMLSLGFLVPVLELVTDAMLAMVNVLDTYVLRPIAQAAINLYNGFVDLVNVIVGWINDLGVFGVRLNEMERMRDTESMLEMGVINQDLIRATDDNTDELREFNRSLTNLPAGFRYSLAEYNAEAANGRGTPVGARGMAGRGDGMTITGPIYITARNANVLEEIRRNMRQRGVPYGGPVGSTPPEKN